ncbi:helix-turn-helix transcriptional regulator [Streptomyces sp. NBC_01244]|uniref:helix-turn-helix transcriptional regulator n=1 Tax=Streptomyces sp. NBC_01244 TaxID=2903797 RepID=UPI002E0D7CD4|nr:helix-turn-helix transcriptional regulator [Streptomyces sp. NBC_01244]
MDPADDLEPGRADSATAFIALLRELKSRSGLTYRQLERRAADQGGVLARSTLADVLAGKKLPRPELLSDFVRACGDGARADEWLGAWSRIAAQPPTVPAVPAERTAAPSAESPVLPGRRRRLLVGLAVVGVLAAAAVVAGITGWPRTGSGAPAKSALREPLPAHLPVGSALWIRPALAPGLCLSDGVVRDHRYDSLVAVQRPCEETAPQRTTLVNAGVGTYRIQWYRPELGAGCLRLRGQGAGAELLEPWDKCDLASHFRFEPARAANASGYRIRVNGQGCVGIKGGGAEPGTEAVVEPCAQDARQIFTVTPVSPVSPASPETSTAPTAS